jgi:hypothetical protein
MEKLACFAVLHSDIHSGAIGMVWVRAGGTPFRDSLRAYNAARLEGLPGPFTAAVDLQQYNDDCAGTLTWDQPVTINTVQTGSGC